MPTKEEVREFSQLIEDKCRELDCGYIDAILYHCQETGLEMEVASTLISPALKAKIREEAQDNNMLKKTAKLPL